MFKDRQGGETNRSSSFYSEAYFQKARKMAITRKPTYRERNKQFYDQQHELDPTKIYINRYGHCQLIRYYQMLVEYFNTIEYNKIKGNEEYTDKTNEVLNKLREIIQHFHARLMSEFYVTREDYDRLLGQGVQPIQWKKEQQSGKLQDMDCERLDCCVNCPIFIEEFQVNLQRTTTLIQKQSPYWQKLNGNQKFSKFKRHIDQLLKVIKHEFEFKCEYAKKENTPKPCKRMKLRLDKKPKAKPRNVSKARKERELQAIAEDDYDIELSL